MKTTPHPPKSVRDTLGQDTGEGLLLEGGQVVLGGAADLDRWIDK